MLRSEEMIDTVATFFARCREWNLTVVDLPTAYWHEMVAVASEQRLRLPESLRVRVIGGERALPERFAQWSEIVGGRHTAHKWLRANGSDCGRDEVGVRRRSGGPGPADGAHRAAYREHSDVRARRGTAAGSGRNRGRALYRWRGSCAWIPESSGFDGGALHPGSFSWGQGPGLHRTGDRVRFRPDGVLEYLGRVDGQIKLRGFRVELGEIEAALRGVTGVRQAVVRAREEVPGETRLVAYVVPEPAGSPSVGDLRPLLKKTLPAHMVPANFVFLGALPMTPNGKLDAAALPAPEPGRPELGTAYHKARTPVEEALTEIWIEVLRVGRVGVDDSFFELGGHSLLCDQSHFQNPKRASRRAASARPLLESHHCGAGVSDSPETGRAKVAPEAMERILSKLEAPANERTGDGR